MGFEIAKKIWVFLRQDVHDFSSFVVKIFDIIDDFLSPMLSYFEKSENEKDNSCRIKFIFWLISDIVPNPLLHTYLIFGVIFSW